MKLVKTAIAASILGLATSANAAVKVIDFEDYSSTTTYEAISNGYKNFDWNNGSGDVYVINKNYHTGTGYDLGTISGSYSAFNAYGTSPTQIDWTGTGNIDFISGYWTSAWNSTQTLSFEGYRDGSLVYSSSDYSINNQSATLIALGWTNVDSIVINSTGTQWVVDDITYNTLPVAPVPEPSTIALMFGGLGLVGFMAARRKKSA